MSITETKKIIIRDVRERLALYLTAENPGGSLVVENFNAYILDGKTGDLPEGTLEDSDFINRVVFFFAGVGQDISYADMARNLGIHETKVKSVAGRLSTVHMNVKRIWRRRRSGAYPDQFPFFSRDLKRYGAKMDLVENVGTIQITQAPFSVPDQPAKPEASLNLFSQENDYPRDNPWRSIDPARRKCVENVKEHDKNVLDNDNRAEVSYSVSEDEKALTIGQLMDLHELDTRDWEVVSVGANQWENFYTKGEGADRTHVLVKLNQLKIFLRRLNPQPLNFPLLTGPTVTVNPIFNVTQKNTGDKGPIRRALIVPDPQIGFKRELTTGELIPLHDRAAMDVVLQIAQNEEFDDVIILGDWLDLANWSTKFLRSPDFANLTNPALAEGVWWLSQLRQANLGATYHFLEGNHEKRVRDSIVSNLAEMYQIAKEGNVIDNPSIYSMEHLLGLKKMGYKVYKAYPDGVLWLGDHIRISHGEKVRSGGGKTTSSVLASADCTEIFGHIHRLEIASKTVHRRSTVNRNESVAIPIHAFSAGCLCRLDDSVPGVGSRKDWQQGCGIVEWDTESRYHNIVSQSISGGVAIRGRQKLLARDHREQLSQETCHNYRNSE